MADRTDDIPDRGRAPAPSSTKGPIVDGYDLLEELGRGSVGVVYKARHRALNRLVALKMVMAGGHVGREQLVRFATEARAVATLRHPAIVQIHEIGESGGLPYLSLEYVDGPSLDRTLGGRPQDPRDAVRLVATLADAVHLAHRSGILHRDIKPANVLISSGGAPKLTDFGLAKDLHDDSSQTCAGTLLGTPCYMAPEQATGDPATLGPAVDIHALGAILYEMLVGRPPFLGATPYETTMQVVNDEPVAPSRLVGALPPDVETICLKCLQKDPAKRYHDAEALADDCRRFLRDEPILSRPTSTLERAWRWCRRNPRSAALTASVAGLVAIVAVGSPLAAFHIEARRQEAETAGKRSQDSAREAVTKTTLALNTLQLLVDETQSTLRGVPGTRRLKSDLLDIALDGLERIAESSSNEALDGSDSGPIGALVMRAHMMRAAIYRDLGKSEKALEEYAVAEAIARRRAAAQPDKPATKGNLAKVLMAFGEAQTKLGRDIPAARVRLEEALRLWRDLESSSRTADQRATASVNVAEACESLAAACARIGDTAVAAALFEEALDRRRDLARAFPENRDLTAEVARASVAMAEIAFTQGDPALARSRYAECVDTFEAIVAASPGDLGARLRLADTLGNYGDCCLRSGAPDEARDLVERALAIHRELAAIDEEDIDLRRSIGVDLYRLAVIDSVAGSPSGTSGRIGECERLRKAIVDQDPDDTLHRIEWMLALARSGDHAVAAGMAADFREGDPDAGVLLDLARCFAQCAVAAGGTAPDLAERYIGAAADSLDAAVRSGFVDVVSIRTDPDLTPLRADPRFVSLSGGLTPD